MKKRIALALAMAICLSLLCTVALADKVTVNFFHRWPNEPKNSYINSLIDEFEAANPDIDIVADCVLNDSYKEKIRVLVSTDALPDVFFSWSGVFGENLTRSGRVLALDDVMARDSEWSSQIVEGQWAPFNYNGKQYGAPWSMDGKAFFYNVDGFNELYDASFYNLIMYGADMRDCEKIADYLIGHYEVKNLVLNVYLDNGLEYDEESDRLTKNLHYKEDPDTSALSFYTRYLFADPRYALAKLKALRTDTILPQTFDVFDEQTGCYDKRVRDAEPIGAMDSYLERYPVFTDYPHQSLSLPYTDACMQSVAAIKARCEAAGVNLVVVAGPVYAEYLQNYQAEDVAQFYQALAAVTPYWDFSSSSVSCEPRYFYDGTHFRNNVGEMMCARIAGRTDLWMPDDFGTYVTADTPASYFTDVLQPTALTDSAISTRVPILMYHHLAEDVTNDEMVSPEQFEAQIRALSEAGYAGISFDELQAYVLRGEPLPKKPVVITFDDGYLSNYTLAYPILQKYGMKATIFSIGVSFGKDHYKDTDYAMTPHFGAAEAAEMAGSGLISIQSHTYDMHQWPPYEDGSAAVRENILQLPGESEEAYVEALTAGVTRSRAQLEAATGRPVDVLAYPAGQYSTLTQVTLQNLGVHVTLSTNPGINTVVKGLPQTLTAMLRFGVTEDLSPEALLEMIQ